jgi:hypothetical protein
MHRSAALFLLWWVAVHAGTLDWESRNLACYETHAGTEQCVWSV